MLRFMFFLFVSSTFYQVYYKDMVFWQPVTGLAVISKLLSLLVLLGYMWLFFRLAFRSVTPSLEQIRKDTFWYLLYVLLGLLVVKVLQYFPLIFLPSHIRALLFCLALMLIYALYYLIHYGFINKRTKQPIWLRKGFYSDSRRVFISFRGILMLQLMTVISDAQFKLIDHSVIVLFTAIFIAVGYIMSKSTLDMHKLACEQYLVEYSAKRKKSISPKDKHKDLYKVSPQQAAQRDENIKKYKLEQSAQQLERAKLPWWRFW